MWKNASFWLKNWNFRVKNGKKGHFWNKVITSGKDLGGQWYVHSAPQTVGGALRCAPPPRNLTRGEIFNVGDPFIFSLPPSAAKISNFYQDAMAPWLAPLPTIRGVLGSNPGHARRFILFWRITEARTTQPSIPPGSVNENHACRGAQAWHLELGLGRPSVWQSCWCRRVVSLQPLSPSPSAKVLR